MVALMLSPEALRAATAAARDEAHRVRAQSAARRADARRARVSAVHKRAKAAMTFAWLAQTRELRYRSPWSDLPWRLADAELDHVLVPHDGLR